jgi:hypothetical protein
MNMNTRILLFLSVVLAGCQSAPEPQHAGPYVRPGLIMVPVDQAHLYGLCRETDQAPGERFAATDTRSVQTESPVSALQFNRYADPALPDVLMHEAHIVYRRENKPRWKLQPSGRDEEILIGPRLTDGRAEIRPLASQELDTFMRDQRSHAEREQQLITRIAEGMKQLAGQQQQLAEEVGKLKSASNLSRSEGNSEDRTDAGAESPGAQ